MKIVNVLREECVVLNAKFTKKAEVLLEVARTAKKSEVLSNVSENEILKGLEARESLGSTGVGKGIAIPHCRLESVSDFVVGLITVPSGVDFKALDKQKVNIIIFIVAPKAAANKHLRLLSMLSQTLLMPGVIDEILTQNTPEGVRESFLKHAASDIEADGEAGKSLVHVFVQDESMFKEILQVLAAVPSSSIAVLGAENTGAYLMKMPLFAAFWSDEPSKFSRIIIATVKRGLANETVRRIESVTGDLAKKAGVLVTVQEVSYAAGSLDA